MTSNAESTDSELSFADDIRDLALTIQVTKPHKKEIESLEAFMSNNVLERDSQLAFLSIVAILDSLTEAGFIVSKYVLTNVTKPHKKALLWIGLTEFVDTEALELVLDAMTDESEESIRPT